MHFLHLLSRTVCPSNVCRLLSISRHTAPYSVDAWTPLYNRYFLDQVAGWILELDRGKGIPFEGNYSAWLEAKNKRLSAESKSQVRLTCTSMPTADQ
jgi:hypothetical protein